MTTSAEFRGVSRWSVIGSRMGSLVICILQWTDCDVLDQRARFRARWHPRNPQSRNDTASGRAETGLIARSTIRTLSASYAARRRSPRLRLQDVARQLRSGPHADLAKDFV